MPAHAQMLNWLKRLRGSVEKPPVRFTSGPHAYLPATQLPSVARGGLWTCPGSGVWIEPPATTRAVERGAPSFHDDPDCARLFDQLEACRLDYPPIFIAAGENIRQIGSRGYLTADGHFFCDEVFTSDAEQQRHLDRLAQPDPFWNEYSGLAPSTGPAQFTFDSQGRSTQHLKGETVSLCSVEGTNFGSFMFRVLPKLAGIADLVQDRRVLVPWSTGTMRDLLLMAGLSQAQIVQQDRSVIYTMDRAIVPALRNPHGLLDPRTVAFYAALRERHGTQTGGRRVYVSRLGWNEMAKDSVSATHRVMINEAELANRLEAHGFQIIRPHAMTMQQQIEAFSAADLVVGAAGSAMFNAVFCRPGTRLIDIESEPHWIFAHMNLFGSCGLDYGIFEGKTLNRDSTTPHKPFSVNIDALLERALSPG